MKQNCNGQIARLLIVEDDRRQTPRTRTILEEARVTNSIEVVPDGEEALRRLRQAGVARPNLILLDWLLPNGDSRELLAEMQADPELRTIPVVVMAESKAELGRLRESELHANAYLTKPVELNEFLRAVRELKCFRLAIVTSAEQSLM